MQTLHRETQGHEKKSGNYGESVDKLHDYL